MPTGDTVMTDAVLGHVRFKNAAVDDTVLLKSDGFPTYHLACVVDDIAMEISHVIRGQEWLSSSPKHLALYAALGKPAPTWAHVPLLLDENRAKLSKRNNSASVDQYQAAGYLPESVVNWVALLGWHPGSTTEVMSMPELIEAFSVDGLNKANCVVDLHKLAWIQGHHIRQDMAASAVPAKPSPQLLASEPALAVPRTDRAWQLWLRIQPHLEAAIAAAQATPPGGAATEAASAAAAAVAPAQLDASSIPEPPAELSLSGHTWPTQYALAALQAQHVRARYLAHVASRHHRARARPPSARAFPTGEDRHHPSCATVAAAILCSPLSSRPSCTSSHVRRHCPACDRLAGPCRRA